MSNEYAKGLYKVRVDQQSFKEAKSGSPQLVLDVTVLGLVGADNKVTPVPAGRRPLFLSLAPPKPGKEVGAIHISFEKLKCAFPGWNGDFALLSPESPGHYSFVGKEITAYNHGKSSPTSKYDDWDLPNTGKPRERKNNTAAAQKAAAIFKSLGMPGPTVQAAVAAPPPEDQGERSYDEVPF